MKSKYLLLLCLGLSAQMKAQDMKIGGTIRGKYEYQTEENKGRFEVRTTRINVSGSINPTISYKAEIDLCDEGQI